MRRLLQRCLKKDSRQLLGAVGDARWMMEEPAEVVGSTLAPAPSRSGTLGWIAAGVLGSVAALLAVVRFREIAPQKAPQRYTLARPENTTLLHSLAISSDGR